jgi:hypothetical protein
MVHQTRSVVSIVRGSFGRLCDQIRAIVFIKFPDVYFTGSQRCHAQPHVCPCVSKQPERIRVIPNCEQK